MIDGTQMARRYLLGELTEAEQAAHEEAYFNDPRLFDEVAAEENALIDEYVRGRLAPELRQRFESAYMSRPERRARVEFAEALLTRVDAPPSPEVPQPRHAGWLTAWLPRPWLAAAAVATAVVIGITAWIVMQSTRRGTESQQTQASNLSPSAPPEAPSGPATPTFSLVTLSLTVGAGQRSSALSAPTVLEIPASTDTVRLALTMRERDYGRYRVVVRAIGGEDILQRGDLRPSLEPSGPAFTIDVPAAAFTSGDYLLTLQGVLTTGEVDDLSQSIIRVRQVR